MTMKYSIPLEKDLIEKLTQFWMVIFGQRNEELNYILNGDEINDNTDYVYLKKINSTIAGTTHLTIANEMNYLGGVGEVGTDLNFRKAGIAAELCQTAITEFVNQGGVALFLGTGNPDAARIYYRLGWRKLAGANVMTYISSEESPEEYILKYFNTNDTEPRIRQGSAKDRIPLIPLITLPHDWQILDANTGIFSTRYATQNSCMGLYPKFANIKRNKQGTWFVLSTQDGKIVGVSSITVNKFNQCQIDGFTHKNYQKFWNELIQACLNWANKKNLTEYYCVISKEDEEKISLFTSLGFHTPKTSGQISINDRPIETIRLIKK